MTQINTYLTFTGNCREAMCFYQECLGGQLTFQTVGEMAGAGLLPAILTEAIVQATLQNRYLFLAGSDMVEEEGLVKGNNISLLLCCDTEREAQDYYWKLVAGGIATYPLQKGQEGALWGTLTDKYGHQWLLSTNPHK
ncbi:VOC family protein [Chitinophaga pendula]|uniref:VOC family protein n=1 Tax=Chitinophaga TaxID=79328 RepID=UPI000BAEA239|nr:MULTISPECIES: VOC family protein [Chitinophaga]ASZ12590.1 VOC family protein [Chitinophaga sp. MD30]UCJ09806.1 VOC family protein [Chitinophaga pendula]